MIFLKAVSIGKIFLFRHRTLLPTWGLLWGLGIWTILNRMKNPQRINRALNLISALALVLPLISVTSQALGSLSGWERPSTIAEGGRLHYTGEGRPPDIYYIVVDSYAREDILRELYGLDNSDFTTALKERGFYVAEASSANHTSTGFSLASSLNMDYIFNLELSGSNYPGVVVEPIKKSTVRQKLEEMGYVTVAMTSGWLPTEMYEAEYFLAPISDERLTPIGRALAGFNSFESLLLKTTVGRILTDLKEYLININRVDWITERMEESFEIHRGIIHAAFDHLSQAPFIHGPKFVFAHIISPHRLYLVGPNGEEVSQEDTFTLDDSGHDPSVEEEFQKYRDQLIYINTRLEETIDSILTYSDSPPIIILQSDTGPAFGFDWQSPDQKNLRTKIAILNAYYLPNRCRDDLYSSISPVNSFRIVFNCTFSGTYHLLDDQTYFSDHHTRQRFDFVPVEELMKASSEEFEP